MVNDFTQHLNLPLPAAGNLLTDDVQRLRDALSMLDTAVNAKAEAADINAALAQLVDSAPAALDSLRELAAALNNDPQFAATIGTNVAALQAAVSVIETTLGTKANQNAVDAALALKASMSDVTAAIAAEAAARQAADAALSQAMQGQNGKLYFNFGA